MGGVNLLAVFCGGQVGGFGWRIGGDVRNDLVLSCVNPGRGKSDSAEPTTVN